jgi:hypothetical protein
MLGSELVNGRSATRTIKRAAALAALTAAALPAAAQAKVVEPVWVIKSVAVTPGQTKSVTLKCPARAVALNGAAPNASSSIPAADARRWTFRFTRSGSATIRCVRLRLPHHVGGLSLIVGTTFEPVFEIPPGFTQQIDVKCTTGEIPTGWGLERRTEDNGLSIAGAVPIKKGWSFAVRNTGPVGAAGSLSARCLERRQHADSGQRHTFSTRIASFTEQVDGSGTTSRSCRANEYSVATGVSLPANDDVLLTGTGLTGERGGEWSFSQPTGATTVQTSLLCLAQTTGFHRKR